MAVPALSAPWISSDLYKIWAALTSGIPVTVTLPNPLPVTVVNFPTGFNVNNFTTLVSLLSSNAGGIQVTNAGAGTVPLLVTNGAGTFTVDIGNYATVNADLLFRSTLSAMQVSVTNYSTLNTLLKATAQPVSGTVAVSTTGFNVNNFSALDTLLKATPQPVSGSVAVTNFLTGLLTASQTGGQELFVSEQNPGAIRPPGTDITVTVSRSLVSAVDLQTVVSAYLAASTLKFVRTDYTTDVTAGTTTQWSAYITESNT